jgi:hypothetical protein
MFNLPDGEQLIRLGMKTAPAPNREADLIKSLLDEFIMDLVFVIVSICGSM